MKVRTRKPGRHKTPSIHPGIFPDLRTWELAGLSLDEMVAQLDQQHGIKVSTATVSRVLLRLRIGDPSCREETILREYLDRFHKHATSDTISVYEQLAAARLVIAILAEQRERREKKGPTVSTADPPSAPGASAAAQMTQDEIEAAVRAQLGKLN